MRIRKLEEELGRNLLLAQHHSVATLNDITDTMLDELRRTSPETVTTYLKFHLREDNEGAFEDFVRDVVRGGMDPRTWGFRDVVALVGEDVRGGALTMSAAQVQALLSCVDGERWVRYSVQDVRRARGGDSGWGAPGVLVRHAPYWWEPSDARVSKYLGAEGIDRFTDHEFVITFRRWQASRASWWAKFKDVNIATASPRQIAEAIGVDMHSVSVDGEIALAALIREAQLPFDTDRQARGFIGPDEWFAGE
jgi:hypothetical protein